MNTIKNTKSKSAVIHINPSTLEAGAVSCHNLSMSQNGALVPAPSPTQIIKGNFTPIYHFPHHDGGVSVFLLSGNTLSVSKVNGNTASTPIEITTLSHTPHCGISSENTVLLMTDNGIYRIDFNTATNSWVDMGYMPQFPAVKITATNLTHFSATTPTFTLSDNYPHWQGLLSKNDQKTLTSHLINTYDTLLQHTSTTGFYAQPILVRYHLLDSDRNVLFSSQPTMITSPSGFQCIDSISLPTNDFHNINSATLSLTAFQLKVETSSLTNSPWSSIVDAVVIESTPIIDPINHSDRVQCRLDSIDATSGSITAYLPGTSITMVPNNSYRMALTKNYQGSFRDVASPLTQISLPFVKGISTILPYTPTEGNTLTSATIPFTASISQQCSDCVLWGNIAHLHHFAPSIGDITSATDDESGYWRAFVSVEFDNSDDIVVWSGEGENNLPTLFSPLLSYPDSHATKITIATSCGGNIVRQSFPLTPHPHHNYAYYLHHSLTPFALTTQVQSFIIPSQHTTPATRMGTIGIADLRNPISLTSMHKISEGEIMAITPTVKISSSWNFARTHIYAFTSQGTLSLSINASHTTITSHLIDNRSITSSQAVAFTNNAVYAIASCDLIAIAGSKSTTIAHNLPISSLSWDSNTHTLYIGTTKPTTMYRYDVENCRMTTCDITPDSELYSTDTQTLIHSPQGIEIFDSNTTYPNIEWAHTLALNSITRRITLASVYISASQFDGTISIRGDSGTGIENSYPITTLNIKGAINAPIPIRIVTPARPYITISVSGTTSPDFQLHNIQLLTE